MNGTDPTPAELQAFGSKQAPDLEQKILSLEKQNEEFTKIMEKTLKETQEKIDLNKAKLKVMKDLKAIFESFCQIELPKEEAKEEVDK